MVCLVCRGSGKIQVKQGKLNRLVFIDEFGGADAEQANGLPVPEFVEESFGDLGDLVGRICRNINLGLPGTDWKS